MISRYVKRHWPACPKCGRPQVQYPDDRIMHTHGAWRHHTQECKPSLLDRAKKWLTKVVFADEAES